MSTLAFVTWVYGITALTGIAVYLLWTLNHREELEIELMKLRAELGSVLRADHRINTLQEDIDKSLVGLATRFHPLEKKLDEHDSKLTALGLKLGWKNNAQ